jgi:hypothetical protein
MVYIAAYIAMYSHVAVLVGAPIQPRFYQEAYRRLVRDGVIKVCVHTSIIQFLALLTLDAVAIAHNFVELLPA